MSLYPAVPVVNLQGLPAHLASPAHCQIFTTLALQGQSACVQLLLCQGLLGSAVRLQAPHNFMLHMYLNMTWLALGCWHQHLPNRSFLERCTITAQHWATFRAGAPRQTLVPDFKHKAAGMWGYSCKWLAMTCTSVEHLLSTDYG